MKKKWEEQLRAELKSILKTAGYGLGEDDSNPDTDDDVK